MGIKVGHASGSENGTIRGKAGDQTGKEVCTRSWYKHSKGWITLECTLPGMMEFIAEAMEKACANPDIGYNQYENGTLWNDVKSFAYDTSETTKKVNTDCARLIRVCVQYACVKMGLDIVIPDFYTATLANVLVKTGLFRKLTDAKYNTQDAYLRRGMIQVTKTKGHTWVILEDGSRAQTQPQPEKIYHFGERTLRNGMEGDDVKEMQGLLIQMGYDLGSWGADGDFGDMTEMAVRAFQEKHDLEVDGIAGNNTFEALLMPKNDDELDGVDLVEIINGNCYARTEPDTKAEILGTCHRGTYYMYTGQTSENGWRCIRYNDKDAWVSGKYSALKKG